MLVNETIVVDEGLRKFVNKVLNNEHGVGQGHFEYSQKVHTVIEKLLKGKKLLKDGEPRQPYVDVIIAAAYVFPIFCEPMGNVTDLFELRSYFMFHEEEFKDCNPELIECVLQTVEGHLGADTPVPLCKPTPNSPTELFAEAVWIAKNFDLPQA